jgi:hypothetical protein
VRLEGLDKLKKNMASSKIETATDDKIFNEYGAMDGLGIGMGNKSLGQSQPHCHFVHHKSQMPLFGIEPGTPR